MNNENAVKTEKTIKHKITQINELPPMDGISKALAITGFVEIENIIQSKSTDKTYYIQKELPFSVLFLEMGNNKRGHEVDMREIEKMVDESIYEDIVKFNQKPKEQGYILYRPKD